VDFLDRAAEAPVLLLATDFDGTLSEIVPTPEAARAAPGALEALAALARAPGVTVAVVSGRSLVDLVRLTPGLEAAWRVGEHGAQIAEPGGALVHDLDPPTSALDDLERTSEAMATVHPGLRVERKRAAVAVHWRAVSPELRPPVLTALARWTEEAERAGFSVIHGRSVHEARCPGLDKAAALAHILSRLPSGALPVYAGDDTTDESAIALAGQRGGVGVYIASTERPSAAAEADLVLDEPSRWVTLLAELASRRQGKAV